MAVTLKPEDFTIDEHGNLLIKAANAAELVELVKQVKQGTAAPDKSKEPHFMVKVAI